MLFNDGIPIIGTKYVVLCGNQERFLTLLYKITLIPYDHQHLLAPYSTVVAWNYLSYHLSFIVQSTTLQASKTKCTWTALAKLKL